MTDFHGRPDSLEAAKVYIDAIAPIRPLFVEEAIQPGDAAAMADLARPSIARSPLANASSLHANSPISPKTAVAYIQPDLAHCGA